MGPERERGRLRTTLNNKDKDVGDEDQDGGRKYPTFFHWIHRQNLHTHIFLNGSKMLHSRVIDLELSTDLNRKLNFISKYMHMLISH